jgi:amino acid adenylation domain-containing protein
MVSIILVGKGGLLQTCIKHLLNKNITPKAILTDDREICHIAKEKQIHILKNIDGIYNKYDTIDYLISINNERILPPKLLRIINRLAINYHNSFLPKYAGINATSHAIVNQETMHGISWHTITEKIDTGDILKQNLIPVSKSDTTETLNIKCFSVAIKSFEEIICQLHSLSGIRQNLAYRTYYGFNDNHYNIAVYWSLPANKILSYINACQFGKEENLFGLARIKLGNTAYIISSAKIVNNLNATKAGNIKKTANKLYISAVDCHIEITELRNCYNDSLDLNKVKPVQLKKQMTVNYHFAIIIKKERWLSTKLSKLAVFSNSNCYTSPVKKINKIRGHTTLNNVLVENILRLKRKNTSNNFFIFIKSAVFFPDKTQNQLRTFDYLYFEITERELPNLDTRPYKFVALKIISACTIDLFFFSRHQYLNVSAFFKGQADFVINSSSFMLIAPKRLNAAQEKSLLNGDHANIKKSAKKNIANSLSEIYSQHEKYKLNINSWMDYIYINFSKKTALHGPTEKLSYSDLCNQVSFLAQSIIQHGVNKGCPVLIAIDNPVALVVGILAIVKSGAFYVPLSTVYPKNRIKYIIKKTKALFFLTNKVFFASQGQTTKNLQFIDIENRIGTYDKNFHFPVINSNDKIYTIFTSGTTGDPKGVIIKHQNLADLFRSTEELFNFYPNDAWVLFHSYCFDFSVWEIFGALLYGGTLHIIPKNMRLSPKKLIKYFSENKISILNQTPSYFYHIVDDLSDSIKKTALKHLRLVVFGGEKLNFKFLRPLITAKKITGQKIQLINMYGITEITIHATFYEISSKDINSNASIIGQFLPGTTALLLDKDKGLVPLGSIGELYLHGPGVSTGYINDKSATKNQFASLKHIGKTDVYYKTGDIARLRKDENYEYINRIDNIKKIRGYRINTDEIKSILLSHNKIKHAEIITIEQKKQNALAAFYQLEKKSAPITKAYVFKYLRKHLPSYMIPSHLKKVDNFPVTENGKIDFLALKHLCNAGLKHNINMKSRTESRFLSACKKILNVNDITLSCNFFRVGGDSMTALLLVSECNKTLNWNLDITDIYKDKLLSKILQTGVSINHNPTNLKTSLQETCTSCSPIEKAIWFSDINCQNNKFNIGFVLLLPEKVNTKKIIRFLCSILAKAALPSSIVYKSKKLVKRGLLNENINVKNIVRSKITNYIRNNFESKVNLSVSTIQLHMLCSNDGRRNVLYLKSHHAVMDGESLLSIINQLKRYIKDSICFNSKINSKYKNYSPEKKRERKTIDDQKTIRNIIYKAVISNCLTINHHFVNHRNFTISIPCELTKKIICFSKKLGVSLPSIFAAAFSLLVFKKYQASPLMGFTVNTRNNNNLNTIGSYSNLLPLFIPTTPEIKLKSAVLRTHNDIGTLLSIRDCPPGIILKEMNRFFGSISANLFDFVFTYNDIRKRLQLNGINIHTAILKPFVSKYLCNIEVNRHNNRFTIECWDAIGCLHSKTNCKDEFIAAIGEILKNKNRAAGLTTIKHRDDSKVDKKIPAIFEENLYEILYGIFCNYLNVAFFDKNTGFFELGITSLGLIELSSNIERDLNIAVQPTIFFINPNFNALYQTLSASLQKRRKRHE